jgi:S-formylglutathione hydrolase FrmB
MTRTVTALVLLTLAAPGVPARAQSSATPPAAAAAVGKTGTVQTITVHGRALVGNLAGDTPDRPVFVYLPPSYATSRNRRYPVAYLLHGYGLTGEAWMTFANVAAGADAAIAAGMRELIVVSPDAFNKWSGSMYAASPTIGDWETFIAEDLVAHIDRTYRTLATREGRGLGGHSMGGYGTLRIGMKRPDVFSSLYAMSACCLLNDPVALGGGGRGRANAPSQTSATAPGSNTASTQEQPGRASGARGAAPAGRGRGFNVQGALAAAYASNPKNPPDYFDQPMKDGVLQPLIAAKYYANSPLAMVDQYLTNLRKYRAIAIEIGDKDTLFASNRQLSESLTNLGLTHSYAVYDGDHTNRVPQRIQEQVLPFFATNLAAAR